MNLNLKSFIKAFIFIIIINSKVVRNNFDYLYNKVLKIYSIINLNIIINEFVKVLKVNKGVLN